MHPGHAHPRNEDFTDALPARANQYEWNINAPEKLAQAQAATRSFFSRIAALGYLRAQLLSARDGTLTPDWRDTLVAASDTTDEPAADDSAEGADTHVTLTDDQLAACRHAAEEIAAGPAANWHPHRNVGWRLALDAWFDATKQCLDAAEHAEQEVRSQSWMSVDDVTARIDMDRDLATASYRAGLAAGGLDVEWYDWLVERVRRWPDKQRRDDQLDLMTLEPGYRESMQQLPSYWA